MGRVYNVIDADGHILEPLDLWDNYIDPAFRDRAPRIVKGENGKERLVIEEQVVGDGQREPYVDVRKRALRHWSPAGSGARRREPGATVRVCRDEAVLPRPAAQWSGG